MLLINRTPIGTILNVLYPLYRAILKGFNMIMFAEGDGGGDGGAGAGGSGGGDGGAAGGDGGGDGGNLLGGGGSGNEGGDKGGGESWRSGLSDEIKNDPSLATFDSTDALARSFLERNKLIGRKGIIQPAEGASQAEVDKYYNALGRPEKVEGYILDEIQMPNGINIDETQKTAFLNKSHELGLTPAQVNGLMQWQVEGEGVRFAADTEASTTAANEAETKLRNEWGAAYDANMALANKVIIKFGDKEDVDNINNGIGVNHDLVRFMAKIGKAFGEDTLGEGVASLTHTPAEAQAEIDKIRSNKDHPYHNLNHPENKAARQEVDSLYLSLNLENKKE